MIELIIWFAALLCPNPTHTSDQHGNITVTNNSSPDTGGETGGIPKPPPPPPPPGG